MTPCRSRRDPESIVQGSRFKVQGCNSDSDVERGTLNVEGAIGTAALPWLRISYISFAACRQIRLNDAGAERGG